MEFIVYRCGWSHVIDNIDPNVSLILVGRHQHTVVHSLHVVMKNLPAQVILNGGPALSLPYVILHREESKEARERDETLNPK